MRDIQAVPGIPANEKVWVKYTALDGTIYYITSDRYNRNTYFIYQIVENEATKLGEGADPSELEIKYIKNQKEVE